ncbi:MAG TPA: carbohydrate porin [Acetobacteraceae bacterium]|jgi:porin|nr:carbohydrate porin [Acetobacteraceae bacterium]
MLLTCSAVALPAAAQTNSNPGSQLVIYAFDANTPAYSPPDVEHLLGDPWDVRSYLENHGIYLRLNATAEFAGNVSGGTKQGATSANQIAFQADVDWQKLAGATGLSTHVIFVNRSGASDSELFGDNVSPVQEIFGAGGNVAVHLVSAYAEEKLYGGMLDLAGGWMNVENDFASSPLYCNYMNNALCGDPKALPAADFGHSAFPDATWGGRIRIRPVPDIYVVAGAYEVNEGLYGDKDRTGFEFDVPQSGGVYVPIQLGYEPKLGADQIPGHYVLGFGYDSSRFKSFSSALPGMPTTYNRGNTQFWALADQMLVRNGKGDQGGIIVLAGFVNNNADRVVYGQQYIFGLLDQGFWQARPEDAMGLLFTYFSMSGALGKVQAQQVELGLPVSNSATGIQGHEMILEANYNIHVYRGVDFRPEFQYVFRPNAQSNIRNAAVFGFKANVEF